MKPGLNWRYNVLHLASANQLGDGLEARFDASGGVYGPDGTRLARRTGAMSVGEVGLDFPARWHASFGSTLLRTSGTSTPNTVAGLVRP